MNFVKVLRDCTFVRRVACGVVSGGSSRRCTGSGARNVNVPRFWARSGGKPFLCIHILGFHSSSDSGVLIRFGFGGMAHCKGLGVTTAFAASTDFFSTSARPRVRKSGMSYKGHVMLSTSMKRIPLCDTTSQHDQFSSNEEHPENDFVVLS